MSKNPDHKSDFYQLIAEQLAEQSSRRTLFRFCRFFVSPFVIVAFFTGVGTLFSVLAGAWFGPDKLLWGLGITTFVNSVILATSLLKARSDW